MRFLDSIFRGGRPGTFGGDTDKSMKDGFADVAVRAIMDRIGPGDLAEDCDAIDLYCTDRQYQEAFSNVRRELLRQLNLSREDLRSLREGIERGGFRVCDGQAPEGAVPVEGLPVDVHFVLKRQRNVPCRITFFDRDGRTELFRMDPPRDGNETPRCYIGRNVPGGRRNDVSLEDTRVSRRQATVIWHDGGWAIQSECNHTWIGLSHIQLVKFIPLGMKGVINCADPRMECPGVLFVQEPCGEGGSPARPSEKDPED